MLAGENLPLTGDQDEVQTIRTDLILQSLDLRLRIVSLPGRPAGNLGSVELRQPLGRILLEFPETAAIALVADDDQLSARIIEPSEVFDAVGNSRTAEEPVTLGELTRAYLRRGSPAWTEPDFVAGKIDDLTADAAVIAGEAQAELQRKTRRPPEAKEAREGLSRADAVAVSGVALAALRGDAVDELIENLIDRADRR
jgi:hypothetical protein